MAIAKKTSAAPTAEEAAAAFETIAAFVRATGSLPGAAPAASVKTPSAKSTAAARKVLDESESGVSPIKELRALAVELGLDEQKQKNAILAELEAKGHFGDSTEDDEDEADEDDEEEDEEEEEEDDEEDEDEDDEDEDEADLTEEDLQEMDLKELRALAKEQGHEAAAYRGKDKDALIELLMGEGDEDEDEADEEEEEEEEIDEDTLRTYDLPKLKGVAADLGIKISPRIAKNKNAILNKILESASEE